MHKQTYKIIPIFKIGYTFHHNCLKIETSNESDVNKVIRSKFCVKNNLSSNCVKE